MKNGGQKGVGNVRSWCGERERERGAKVAYLGRKKLRALGLVAEELECYTEIEERWWRQWKRCECRHSKVRFSWWLKMGIFWKIRRLHWD